MPIGCCQLVYIEAHRDRRVCVGLHILRAGLHLM
jgi:hypothetical protein